MVSPNDLAKRYGYSIEDWDVFVNDPNLPHGLLERVLREKSDLELEGVDVSFVLYDARFNHQGVMLFAKEELALNGVDGPLSDREGSEQYLKPTKGVSFH